MPDVSYPFLEKLIATAKTNYPKIKMYGHRVEIAKTGVTKAKLSWFNVMNFNYLYSPNNTSTLVNPTLFNGYQVGLYFNFGSFFSSGPSIKIAKGELEVAKDNQDEYNLNIEAEVKKRYYNYIKELSILNLKTKSATDVESTVKQVKYKFEKGEESLDNYIRGLNSYSNAVQAKIESESNVLTAKCSLEELLGEKLEEVK